MILSSNNLQELADHNVLKVGVNDGDITEIGNLRLMWKARGADTGFQFSIYETELTPGSGVPLHKHPFAEFLYVLDGTVNFARVGSQGKLEWLESSVGECVQVPANAPHGMENKSRRSAKVLSVSSYQHELILTEGGRFVLRNDPSPSQPAAEDLQHFTAIAQQNQAYWVEVDAEPASQDHALSPEHR